MAIYEETRLWATAFAPRQESTDRAKRRAALMHAYDETRANATLLAAEIAQDMKFLTVHDASHLDALWELASDVGGEQIVLTATEGFVLGGAILLHDLGLGTAAYPGGRASLESGSEWNDAIALVLRNELRRYPTRAEIDKASASHRDEALRLVLRQRHAAQAEQLGQISWRTDQGASEEQLFLISSPDLRRAYGDAIGLLAGSHWWPIGRVRRDLDSTLNPVAGQPGDWTVDLLKLACLLRIADAIHLDARRAPAFLQALRAPEGQSELHWTFQGRLHRPTVVDDRVRFTSGEPFGREESAAWWLGLDLVRLADRELRSVDDLLADLGRDRFAARGVLAVDAPEAFARLVRTSGWTPIDASLQISDVAGLIARVGGAELYGDIPTVPLRELIQNAGDAIRARRLIEERSPQWGTVTVEAGTDSAGPFVEVRDTGVGMSMETLTTTLLDFGNSTWDGPDLIWAYPGLAGKGFESTGRFGIGFFSTLMWGDRVLVRTRQPDDGAADTKVLELLDGVDSRPLVRRPEASEVLVEAGTAVRTSLTRLASGNQAESAEGRALSEPGSPDELARLCAMTAPASPVSIEVIVAGRSAPAVSADDWMTIPPEELLKRCSVRDGHLRSLSSDARRVRAMRNPGGALVGRACLTSGGGNGVISVGGFRAAELPVVEGLLLGERPNLARDAATPIVEPGVFTDWLEEQAELLSNQRASAWHIRVAATLLAYGLELPELPICQDEDADLMTQRQLIE
jgi:hypothetical protein